MGNITLTLPTSATVITAALHSTNYTTIQTVVNGNIENINIKSAAGITYSKLSLANSIVNADVATAAGIVGSKLATGITGPPGSELDYAQVTTNQTSTATTSAGATAIITGAAVAYDGATAVMIEVFIPGLSHTVANALCAVSLYDGATELGIMGKNWETTTGTGDIHFHAVRRLTPSNASHTYSARLWSNTAGTVTANCGAGTIGVYNPMFLRITKV